MSLFKYLKNLFLILFLLNFINCGAGTQVLSPPNPSEGPTPLSLRIANYRIEATLPSLWTYQRIEVGQAVPAGAYNDEDPNTNLEVVFRKNDNRFSLFSALLETTVPLDQALGRFVLAKHPGVDFQIQRDAESSIPAFITVIDSSTGSHVIIDAYYGIEGICIWFHFDFSGTVEEMTAALDDLDALFASFDVDYPDGYTVNDSVDRLILGLCAATQRCDNTLNAFSCLDAMESSAGNQIWDQFGASWPESSLSSDQVRAAVNNATISLQSPAYENCLNQLALLCTDSFRISAGSDYSNAENLMSVERTPACASVIR